MSTRSELHEAIGSYAQWRARLRNAVATGRAEVSSAQTAADDACEFGKWMYALPPAERREPHFSQVRQLHSRLHAEAAEVLRLVESGHLARAGRALESGSSFELVGRELTAALLDWSRAA